MGFLSDLADATPGLGTIKSVYHYARGEKEKGNEALYQSTRTSAVMLGGIFGGPGGSIGAGFAADAAASFLMKKEKGIIDSAKNIGEDIAANRNPTKSIATASLKLSFDALSGYGSSSAGNASGKAVEKTVQMGGRQAIQKSARISSAEITKMFARESSERAVQRTFLESAHVGLTTAERTLLESARIGLTAAERTEREERKRRELMEQRERERIERRKRERRERERIEQREREWIEQGEREWIEQGEREWIEQEEREWIEQEEREWIERRKRERREIEWIEQSEIEWIEQRVRNWIEQREREWIEQREIEWIEQREGEWIEQREREWIEQRKREWIEQREREWIERRVRKWINQRLREWIEQRRREWIEQRQRVWIEQRVSEWIEQRIREWIEETVSEWIEQRVREWIQQRKGKWIEQKEREQQSEREQQKSKKQEEHNKKEQRANSEKQKRDTSGSNCGSNSGSNSGPPRGNKDNNKKRKEKKDRIFFETFMPLLRKILKIVYGTESEPFLSIFENLPEGQRQYLSTVLEPLIVSGTLEVVIELVVRMFKQYLPQDISFLNFLSLLEFVNTYVTDELQVRTLIASGTETPETKMKPKERREKIISEIAGEKDITEKLTGLFKSLKTEIQVETAKWNTEFPNFRDMFSAVYHYFKHRKAPHDGRILSVKEYYDWIRIFLGDLKQTQKLAELKYSKDKKYVHNIFVPIFRRRFRIVLTRYGNNITLSSAFVVTMMHPDDKEKHAIIIAADIVTIIFMAINLLFILKNVFFYAPMLLLSILLIVFNSIAFMVNQLLSVLLFFIACCIFVLKVLLNILLILSIPWFLFFYFPDNR